MSGRGRTAAKGAGIQRGGAVTARGGTRRGGSRRKFKKKEY